MKYLHTAIMDTLINYFPFDQATEMAFNLVEFAYNSSDVLHFEIFDMIADFLPESKAKKIADEVIFNIY